jgi:hypothetical protein
MMISAEPENSIDHQKFKCGAVHGENMTNQSAAAAAMGKTMGKAVRLITRQT